MHTPSALAESTALLTPPRNRLDGRRRLATTLGLIVVAVSGSMAVLASSSWGRTEQLESVADTSALSAEDSSNAALLNGETAEKSSNAALLNGETAEKSTNAVLLNDEESAPVEVTLDLFSLSNVRTYIKKHFGHVNETERLHYVPRKVRVRLWPERVARGEIGDRALSGYVAFSLVHLGLNDHRTISYLVVVTLKGELVAAWPGPTLHTAPGDPEIAWINGLKPFDDRNLLLSLNGYSEDEWGPVHAINWRTGETTVLANSSWGAKGSSHDVQWYAGGSDHALADLFGERAGVFRPYRHYHEHGVGERYGVALYDNELGTIRWNWTMPASTPSFMLNDVNHFQVLQEERALILNGRLSDNFIRVDLDSADISWVCGGDRGTFTITDIDGHVSEPGSSHLWSGAHNLEYFGDGMYYMFDNAFNNTVQSLEGMYLHDSRLLGLRLDHEKKTARVEVEVGLNQHTSIYGDADLLPTGNVLGSNWPRFVGGETLYDVHVFEVLPHTGDLAWDLRLYGAGAEDTEPTDRSEFGAAPYGWSVYSAERFYQQPLLGALSATLRSSSSSSSSSRRCALVFRTWSSFKHPNPADGEAVVTRVGVGGDETKLASKRFSFAAHWMATEVALEFSVGAGDAELHLSVYDQWDQAENSTFHCA